MKGKSILLARVSLVFVVVALAAGGAVAGGCSVPAGGVDRIYLVRNQNGFLVAYQDAELDEPGIRTKVGSVAAVKISGQWRDVETTLIVDGLGVRSVDRFIPVGDADGN